MRWDNFGGETEYFLVIGVSHNVLILSRSYTYIYIFGMSGSIKEKSFLLEVRLLYFYRWEKKFSLTRPDLLRFPRL